MPKIIMLEGLPASGKSTWAKEQVEKSGGKIKRVNRDLLRDMVDAGKWSGDREREIVQIQTATIKHFISKGYDVIIDDTNLAPKTQLRWMNLATELNCSFEIKKFDTDIHECIRRDQKRPNYVGEKVISRMYHQFLSPPTPFKQLDIELSQAYIFDIDGTLAMHTNRTPFEYKKCMTDSVNFFTRAIMQRLTCTNSWIVEFKTLIVSGRPAEETIEIDTINWLRLNGIYYNKLFMRKAGDQRRDDIVKREIYEKHIKNKYEVMGVFDDRLRTCRMWHLMGLPVFRVGDPDANF